MTTAPARSLYELILRQLDDAPDAALDIEALPPVGGLDESGIKLAPGLGDQLFGEADEEEQQWKTVVSVVRAINDGQIERWAVAEESIRDVPTAANVDRVLDRLLLPDITPRMKSTFWEIATRSSSYEAVKWGIALGGIRLTEEEVEPLLVLARHPEFTLYASHVLMRESAERPELRGKLLELLPLSRQWGVVTVIEYILRDAELAVNAAVQRALVVYGMENHDGVAMELAFTIAKAVDWSAIFEAVKDDQRLFEAVVELVGTLIDEPAPLGGLADLENAAEVHRGFRALLESRDPDIAALAGLHSLCRFLDAGQDSTIHRLLRERASDEALRRGLRSQRFRHVALALIEDLALAHLLPQVRDAFDRDPDANTIDVLGKLGGREDLIYLLEAIPRLVDLEARRTIPRRDVNSFGPEHRYDFEYARIITYMGDLGTPAAVAAIEEAAGDYDPSVRAAATTALGKLRT